MQLWQPPAQSQYHTRPSQLHSTPQAPTHSLTPTLVLHAGQPVLAISVAGGDLQDQATLNLLLDFIEFGA